MAGARKAWTLLQSRPSGIVLVMQLAEFGRRLQWHAYRAPEEGVEGIDPEDLAGEYFSEIAGDGFGYGVQVEGFVQLLLHRRNWLCGDAAGDDQIEIAQVCVYVEGESVGGDEVGDVDADGGEFGLGMAILGG